jgi:hypothetical protein
MKLSSLSSEEETKSSEILEESSKVTLNARIVKSEPGFLSSFQERPTPPTYETISSLLSDSDERVLHDLQRISELVTNDASSIPLQNLQRKSIRNIIDKLV